MKKNYLIICGLLLSVITISKAQVTIGASTYTSVNAAFTAINAGTHTGVITININGNTTEPTTPVPLNASGQGGANYSSIILRPTVTATISGAMITGRGVLELDGVDNMTIDGDITGGPITRELTVVNSAASSIAATAVIRLIGRTTLGLGATNNTIKNCVVIGNTEGNDGISGSTVTNSHGIYAGTNVAVLTSGGTGADYDNLIIQNNEIRKCYYGIHIGAATANTADNLNINNNTIGSNTAGQTVTFAGINLSGVTLSALSQNEVFNLQTSTSVSPYGIQVAGAGSASVTISRNKVHGVKSLSINGWGAYGIYLNGGNDHLVVNNVVYDIMTVNYTSATTLNAIGIRITSGTGHKIYYNSVNLFGVITLSTASATSVGSAAFFVTSATCTGLDIRNNIFCNTQVSNLPAITTKKFVAAWFAAGYDFTTTTLNNNSYNVSNDPEHFVGKLSTTNNVTEYQTLGNWQTASQVNNPSNDVNSIPLNNVAAPFTSAIDLTIPANTLYGAESGAVLIPALGTNIDYNAAVRPLAGVNPNLNPDMGAYEFDGIAGIANDAGLIALISPASNGCYSAAENVVVTIKNFGTAAISNVPVTINVSGAVNAVYNATYAPSIAPGATANFTVGVLNMLAAGTYSFNGATGLVGDGNLTNDALTVTTRTVIAPSALPQFVDFTGFTGANLTTLFPDWREGAGATGPNGTTSLWLNQANFPATGNTNARINLYTTNRNEWIVGPKVTATASTNITFDAGITAGTTSPFTLDAMGSDDMVRVMVSTDCGVTYSPIFTISATNSLSPNFTNFSVPLSAYAGQDIIVAFLAQDGPVDDVEDYYFHLDNINLYNASPTDAGLTAMTAPGAGCYTAAENVIVTIHNYGTAPITNIPATVVVSGAVSQTLTGTYAGTIPVNSSANFTVGVLNMLPPGVYTFTGSTSLPGDLNFINDAMPTVTRTVLPLAAIPQYVDFTGFTGANLTTFFPDWYESVGAATPSTAASAWTSQTNLNSTGNVNARLNLYTTTRNEWIAGPKISATSTTNISFDAAITANTTAPFTPDAMGSDDMVRVMVSTNCGLSYTPVFTISATNSLTTNFTNFNVSLGAYAGQDIIVGFLAQDGPVDDVEDYYFHLDNINIYNASPIDAGLNALVAPTNGCFSASENVVVDIHNYGTNALSNVPVTVIISGALTQTLTGTYPGSIPPAASANFTVGTINMTTPGTYTFAGYVAMPGDPNQINDTMSVYVKTVLSLFPLPQTVSFTGFTGANLPTFFTGWREGNTAAGTGTTSTWTSQTNLNATGNVNARVLLSAVAANEWLVSPKISATATTQISFDAALTNNTTAPFTPDAMGSDDMLRVMVSANCGASFTPIFTISATNSLTTNFTNFIVPLSAYAGQDIIVAFLAQDGPIDDPESYYFQLDNINLYNNGPVDAGVTNLVAPATNTCYSANESVVVSIKNYGTASLSNIPVTVSINGPVSQTLNASFAGPLAAGATSLFNVGTANMSIGGTYSFAATTSVALDPNSFNDAITTTRNVDPVFGINGITTVCSGNSTTLAAIGSVTSYTWSTSANTSSVIVTPLVNTIYTLTASNGTCSSVKTTTVTVVTPTIAGTGTTVCSPNTGTLSVNAFTPSTVSWYATPTSTTVLGTGNTFTSNAVTTTTYYAEAASTSAGSLQTSFAAGNGCGGGTMFDITPTAGAVVIDSLDVSFGGTLTYTVQLFYRVGTYLGNETNSAAWISWGTVVVTGAGPSLPTRVVTPPLSIPNSQVTGIYISEDQDYTNGTTAYSNTDITLQTGAGLCSLFGGVNAGRMFNGNVYYSKPGCTSPKIPVTLTVNPVPSVSVTTSAPILCITQTVSLTASGANTYSWNTTSTNTVITVSPVVNTTYTVTGTSNGCSSSVAFTQSVSTCTGVDANLAFSNLIKVYPNPSSGIITTDFNFEGEKEILITNSVGQIIMSIKTKNNSEQIDLKNYAKGIYFVKIINETNSVNYRIVTQ